MYHVCHKILCSAAFFNIDNKKNVSWAPDEHIRMISDDHVKLKTWSINAENVTIFHNITIFNCFFFIKSALVHIGVFFLKNIFEILPTPKLFNDSVF